MSSTPVPLVDRLHERLLKLPFDAYVRLVGLLLIRLGYEGVTPAGRTNWKGRNRDGGVDLLASLPGSLTARGIVVQVKQFDRNSRVFQRHIDELRGVALRQRASEALMLTSGPISSALLSPMELEGDVVAPVRVIDGEQLLNLLILHSLGVREDETLDEALLARLIEESEGNSRADSPKKEGLRLRLEVMPVQRAKPFLRHKAREIPPISIDLF
ncbi:MAG: restriction endonuclease [Armatimonas sp.]